MRPTSEMYLLLLAFYFNHEERVKRMAEDGRPDNPADVFIKRIKQHAFTGSFNGLQNTYLMMSVVKKLIIEEDKRNVDKQTACGEDC